MRAAAFIHKDYVATVKAAPDDTAVWQSGIESKLIRIIPEISGSSNGGEKVSGAGYGDVREKVTGRNFTVSMYFLAHYIYDSFFYFVKE